MVGLKESTIRRYRVRGTFPEPDGYEFGHPWWTKETVSTWLAARRIKAGRWPMSGWVDDEL